MSQQSKLMPPIPANLSIDRLDSQVNSREKSPAEIKTVLEIRNAFRNHQSMSEHHRPQIKLHNAHRKSAIHASPGQQEISTAQRESQHQCRQNARAGLVSRRDGIGKNMRLLLAGPRISIRASVRVAHTLAAGVAGIRGLQPADADHVRADGAQRAHLLPDAVRAVPLGLCPFHAARVPIFSAAALAGGRDAARCDVRPDLVGEVGHELRGDGEPAQGVAFEGEAVGVAVALWFAGGFDRDFVCWEEFAEGVVEEAFERGLPFGVFGLGGKC